ncbi:hypothetical protein BgiBS90_030015 [Biomphalaria glabrata]|nr:hypothetical protein BgiBS90_030015 [Biomphalaria glabrata]
MSSADIRSYPEQRLKVKTGLTFWIHSKSRVGCNECSRMSIDTVLVIHWSCIGHALVMKTPCAKHRNGDALKTLIFLSLQRGDLMEKFTKGTCYMGKAS